MDVLFIKYSLGVPFNIVSNFNTKFYENGSCGSESALGTNTHAPEAYFFFGREDIGAPLKGVTVLPKFLAGYRL
jgi:hypothetical protein